MTFAENPRTELDIVPKYSQGPFLPYLNSVRTSIDNFPFLNIQGPILPLFQTWGTKHANFPNFSPMDHFCQNSIVQGLFLIISKVLIRGTIFDNCVFLFRFSFVFNHLYLKYSKTPSKDIFNILWSFLGVFGCFDS